MTKIFQNAFNNLVRLFGVQRNEKAEDDSNSSIKCPWHIPNYRVHGDYNKLNNNNKANRYLKHQYLRISKKIEAKRITQATRMMSFLISKSRTYKVMWFNRTARGWYFNMDYKRVVKTFARLDRILAYSNANLRSSRVYIPKPDGRLRPLGVPTLEWRIYINMWTSFLYMLLDNKIGDNMHGFRPGRSTLSAWEDIWSRLKPGSKVFEFDLESYFNKVNIERLSKALLKSGLPEPLVTFIHRVNTSVPNSGFKDFDRNDKEMYRNYMIGKAEGFKKEGLPQGLPWSPILSIFLMDYDFKRLGIKDVVMYADDGVLISDSDDALKQLDQMELKQSGIFLSPKLKKDGTPSCKQLSDEITFLGLTYKISTQEILYEGNWIARKKLSERAIRGLIWKNYCEPKRWDWGISERSWLSWNLWKGERVWDILITYLRILFSKLRGRRYPVIWKGIHPIRYLEKSSEAMDDLIRRLRNRKPRYSHQNSFHAKWDHKRSTILNWQNTEFDPLLAQRYREGKLRNSLILRDYMERKYLESIHFPGISITVSHGYAYEPRAFKPIQGTNLIWWTEPAAEVNAHRPVYQKVPLNNSSMIRKI